MRFIFSYILLLLVGFMSISSVEETREIQDMERDAKYIIREVVFQINEITLTNPNNIENYCCNGNKGPCNSDICELYTKVRYNREEISIEKHTYRINSPERPNLTFRLTVLNSFYRGDIYIQWFTVGNKRWFDEIKMPSTRPARQIFKFNKTDYSNSFILDVLFTINCDIKVGASCEVECLPNNANQRCDPVTGRIMCRLLFFGANCDEEINPCADNPCLNLGKCQSKDGLYHCECVNGYAGLSCEIRPCLSGDCLTGTCLTGDAQCTSSSLYSVGSKQHISCFNDYCYNNGICETNEYGISCNCDNTGAVGKRCEHKCVPACVNGVCDIFKGRPFCACNKEYTGEVCDKYTNIKNCPSSNPCLHGGKCVNGVGQDPYSCKCPSMWTGRVCEIYACSLENCRKGLCAENNLCRCNKNSFGEICQYESCGKNEQCKNKGTCQQTSLYGVSCHCLNDYAGKQCEHKCKNGCGIYGRCKLTQSGPQCECDENHNGEDCSSLIENDECQKLKCLNKGVCTQKKFSYVCECNQHWTGRRCELPTCSVNTCDRGVCLLNKGCQCIKGYVGKHCSSAVCTEDYCSENGICVSNGLSLKCLCDTKISVGDRCELKCLKRCVNGECMFTRERVPKCQCISGYSGERCNVRDFTVLISFVLGGVAGLCAILLIVSLIIFVTAKFCFKAEGNAEDYIYRIDNAIKNQEGDWNALRVQ